MYDSAVLMGGEIRSWSLYVFKRLVVSDNFNSCNFPSCQKKPDNWQILISLGYIFFGYMKLLHPS